MSIPAKKQSNRYVVGYSGYRMPDCVYGANKKAHYLLTLSKRDAIREAGKLLSGNGVVYKLVPMEDMT